MPQATDDAIAETGTAGDTATDVTAGAPSTADGFRALIERAQQAAEQPAEQPATAPAADEPAGEPASPPRRARRALRLAAAGTALAVLVAATVFAVIFGLADAHHRAVTSAEHAATVAARQDAVYISSYDYRSLDQAFGRVTANASGSFKDDFAKTSKALEPTITKAKATATGTVQDIAVQSGSTSSVVLLAFVDQKLTTGASTTPQTVTNRLVITMSKQHGRWLMSNVVTV